MRSTLFAAGLIALCWLSGCAHAPDVSARTDRARLVVFISIDGFRADYLERGLTPNIAAIAGGGVRAVSMRPAFPSVTLPNHYTLMTGLYPDHHGIVNNTMEDPAIPEKFTFPGAKDARWWSAATPLWVTAEQQDVRSAAILWPGSDIPNHGILPSHMLPEDDAMAPDRRVDQTLNWLDLPVTERPSFVALYFNQVDSAGHAAGPDSDAVNQALILVDTALGRLVAGLKQRGVYDRTDMVIVADHGMEGNARDRVVYLDDLVDPKIIHVEAIGIPTGLRAEAGHEAAVEKSLLGRHGHMECWRKGELPARFHYGANPRVPAIVCLPDIGWAIWTHDFIAKLKGAFVMGMHGYDNAEPHMQALFIAEGPSFQRGVVHPAFDNVDVYPLIAHLLAVKAEPNDGRFSDVADMLKPGAR